MYCNIGNCIAVRPQGWAGSVLQYTGLHCREEGRGIVLQDGCSWHRIVLQYNLLYCKRRLGKLELYRNTLRCIATVEQRQGWTVLRYNAQPSHNIARRRAAGVRGAQAARACGPWASGSACGRTAEATRVLTKGGRRARRRHGRAARGALGARALGRWAARVRGRGAARVLGPRPGLVAGQRAMDSACFDPV